MADEVNVNFFDPITEEDIERLMGVAYQGFSCLPNDRDDPVPYNSELLSMDISREEAKESENTDLRSLKTGGIDNPEQQENTCTFCGKCFSTMYNLMRHEKIHTGHGLVHCDLCDLECRDNSRLKCHKEEVHFGIKYTCEECGSSFSRKSLLSKDRKTHTGVADYMCHICGKGYYDKNSFEAHVNGHDGTIPYKCETCGKGFANETRQKRHKKTCGMKEGRYVCEECGRHFKAARYLKEHLNCHKEKKYYQCDTCGQVFFSP